MRRKLYLGLSLAAFAGLVAGGLSFTQPIGAQDAPKKAEPEQKKDFSDLFEIFKKDLELKKVPAPADLPPLTPLPPPDLSPLTLPPPVAPTTGGTVIPPPTALPAKDDKQTTPPPVIDAPKPAPLPAPPTTETKKDDPFPPFPSITNEKPAEPKPPVIVNQPAPSELPKPTDKPGQSVPPVVKPQPAPVVQQESIDTMMKQAAELMKQNKLTEAEAIVNRVLKLDPEYVAAVAAKSIIITRRNRELYANDPGLKPMHGSLEPTFPSLQPTPPVKPSVPQAIDPPAVLISPRIAEQAVRQKDSPWSLHVEMIDGQTIVTAMVNKKHEFKIVCQSLDLQTGKGTLKATGKVQISGDMLNGSCDALAISLLEDRLILEGSAAVTIQKIATTVSDTKPAAFELKGDKLDLRISELQSSRFLQTSRPRVHIDENVRQAGGTEPIVSPQWSPYGTLVRNASKVGPEWRLEKSNGEVIAYIVVGEGKSLESYVGRTIAVHGAPERKVAGYNNVLRVTHIAAQ